MFSRMVDEVEANDPVERASRLAIWKASRKLMNKGKGGGR